MMLKSIYAMLISLTLYHLTEPGAMDVVYLGIAIAAGLHFAFGKDSGDVNDNDFLK